MTATIAFDTLAYAKKLQSAGVTAKVAEVQAEALAEIIEQRLATKRDILELKRDIKEMEMRLTIRLGTIVTVGIAAVAAIVQLL